MKKAEIQTLTNSCVKMAEKAFSASLPVDSDDGWQAGIGAVAAVLLDKALDRPALSSAILGKED